MVTEQINEAIYTPSSHEVIGNVLQALYIGLHLNAVSGILLNPGKIEQQYEHFDGESAAEAASLLMSQIHAFLYLLALRGGSVDLDVRSINEEVLWETFSLNIPLNSGDIGLVQSVHRSKKNIASSLSFIRNGNRISLANKIQIYGIDNSICTGTMAVKCSFSDIGEMVPLLSAKDSMVEDSICTPSASIRSPHVFPSMNGKERMATIIGDMAIVAQTIADVGSELAQSMLTIKG